MNRLECQAGPVLRCRTRSSRPAGPLASAMRSRSFTTSTSSGQSALKGTTLRRALRQPDAAHRRVRGGACSTRSGLQNPGVTRRSWSEELPKLRTGLPRDPIIANISGFSLEEYVETAKMFDAPATSSILEINISCPNVKRGGMAFGTQPELAAEITAAVKAAATKPVYMKLSPNVTDIVAIAKACEEAGADGHRRSSTRCLGMRIDPRTGKPVVANGTARLFRSGDQAGRACAWSIRCMQAVKHAGHRRRRRLPRADDVHRNDVRPGRAAVQIGAQNLRQSVRLQGNYRRAAARNGRTASRQLADIIDGARMSSHNDEGTERRVIIACDFSTRAETLAFLDQFTEEKPYVKIGMELFYGEGPAGIVQIKAPRAQNLPRPQAARHPQHRSKGDARCWPGSGVDMTNVHAAGTHGHDARRVEGLSEGHGSGTAAAADRRDAADQHQRGAHAAGAARSHRPIADTVSPLCAQRQGGGLDGVVCSPLEAGLVQGRPAVRISSP